MAAEAPARPYHILLVEDDAADAMLVEEVLLDVAATRVITRVTDGMAALTHLRNGANPRPDLIVLDLNMPRMNGAELLAILKQDPELKGIPVVILTTSAAREDVSTAYNRHANAYVVKPVNLDDFTGAVQGIDAFYRELAARPLDS